MTLNIHDTIRSQLSAVDANVDRLETLGVISATDADKARAAVARAQRAETLSVQYNTHIESSAEEAGRNLADVDDLDIETVIGSNALPDPDTVDITLGAIWNKATHTARAAAFRNNTKIPAALTERFDAVANEVLEIAAKLGVIETPQEAIDAGLTKEWQRLMGLKAEYNELSTFRTDLRSYYLIPGPNEYNGGWQWAQRTEYPLGSFKNALAKKAGGDEGRALLILTARCRPYCPADKQEADEVLKAAVRGETVA